MLGQKKGRFGHQSLANFFANGVGFLQLRKMLCGMKLLESSVGRKRGGGPLV